VRAFAPLSDPLVARLWAANAIVTTGDEVFRVALVWLAVETVGQNVGYLGALTSGSMLAGAMFGGTLAGALEPRKAMSIYCLFGAAFVAVPFLLWEFASPAFAALALAGIAVALMRAQLEPAVQGALPLLVPNRDLLFATNALIDGLRRLARVTGPLIAALLALALPIHDLFLIDALALVLAAWLFLEVGRRLPPREPREAGGFVLGLKIVRDEPVLKRLLLLKCMTDGAWVLIIAQAFPLIVATTGASWAPFGIEFSGVGAFGLGIAIYGLANVASNVAVGALPATLSIVRMLAGSTWMCVGLVAMAVGPLWLPAEYLLPALYGALAMSALGSPFYDIPLTMRVQLSGGPAAPRAAAASVHRVRIVVAFVGIFLAGLLSPGLFAAFEPGPSMLGAGLFALGCCAFGWVSLAKRGWS
jgi:MFS transporter, DHA3 family, macrolide efflux protein